MDEGIDMVAAAGIAFVGTHFLLSHPLRRPLVQRVGERGFLLVYSLIAAVTLGWLVMAYRATPMSPLLWPVGDELWAVATVVMLIASVLLMGSLVRNPALPTGGTPAAVPDAARGVYAITRHPMMWSFALWALAHALVYPVASNLVLLAAVLVLALVGAALQDLKKEQLEPVMWRAWEGKTSYWPFVAIARGRARLGGFGGQALGGGLVLWLAATWLHLPISGWPAGIWRWI